MTYSAGEPYDSGLMPTGDGHRIYWEVSGNPAGKPAVEADAHGAGDDTTKRLVAALDRFAR